MTAILPRYHAILKGSEQAQFRITRSVEAVTPEDRSLEDLWRLHDVRMERMRELAEERTPPVKAERSLLDLKVRIAMELLKACCLCDNNCGVDRTADQRGRCGVLGPKVASHFVHHGEEEMLVPSYTVFFAGCNMQCVFCQNYDISTDPDAGLEIVPEDLATMIDKQAGRGARNVNWVGGDPTPDLPYVLEVMSHIEANIPQVWNSNMYLSEKAMSLLDGAVDIYLTDLKYGNDGCAMRLSGINDYMGVVGRNHLLASMHGEVIVRHLILPGHLICCTIPALDWIADNIPTAAVNIMAQYHPQHRASEFPELRARVLRAELSAALEHARRRGLHLI